MTLILKLRWNVTPHVSKSIFLKAFVVSKRYVLNNALYTLRIFGDDHKNYIVKLTFDTLITF